MPFVPNLTDIRMRKMKNEEIYLISPWVLSAV